MHSFQTWILIPIEANSKDRANSFCRSRKYFYITRFMFAFTLIALFFAVLSLFTGLIALCSRIGSYISSLLCLIALIFQTVATGLMTYVYPEFLGGGNKELKKQCYHPCSILMLTPRKVLDTSKVEMLSTVMAKRLNLVSKLSLSCGRRSLYCPSLAYSTAWLA